MTIELAVGAAIEEFRSSGRIVIVGASLAGLRAAEALRKAGFRGRLTLVGDEPYEPYARPPLSKQVLTGRFPPESHDAASQADGLDAEWRLGTAAVGLDLDQGKRVRLADGDEIGFDRLLIATGTRARAWPNPAEAALDGVLTLRGRDDTVRLRRDAWPPGRAGSWSSAPGSPAPRSPRCAAVGACR